jgi:hypothetical protein
MAAKSPITETTHEQEKKRDLTPNVTYASCENRRIQQYENNEILPPIIITINYY